METCVRKGRWLTRALRRAATQIRTGALYRVELDGTELRFAENEETSAVCFWDGAPLAGGIDAIDAGLARLA